MYSGDKCFAQFIGSTKRPCTTHCHFPLAGCMCLSLSQGTGNLERILCLLLPSSFLCMCFLSCNMSDELSFQNCGLGTAPGQNTCFCALLSVLGRRGILLLFWTGSLFNCCSDLHTQEIHLAKLFYSTFVKHVLTVCKCMVFEQRSLYYQMQTYRQCSSG